jgi:hypothetical protein
MSIGRPKATLVVSDEDRATLMRWTAWQKTSQALALRARIVLESSTRVTNTQVAARLGVTKPTVGRWPEPLHRQGPRRPPGRTLGRQPPMSARRHPSRYSWR